MNTPHTLAEALASVPDPRQPEGRRHALPAILTHIAAGLMAGCTGLNSLVAFARDRDDDFLLALGYRPCKRSGRLAAPCAATLSILLRRLDVHAAGAALRGWLQQRFADQCQHERRAGGDEVYRHAAALDGKVHRGTAHDDASALHVLNLYCPALQHVIDQFALAEGQGELTAALAYVAQMPDGPQLLTADAAFTQRELCQALVDRGKDYVLPVKDNQPTLLADIKQAFTPHPLSHSDAAGVLLALSPSRPL